MGGENLTDQRIHREPSTIRLRLEGVCDRLGDANGEAFRVGGLIDRVVESLFVFPRTPDVIG